MSRQSGHPPGRDGGGCRRSLSEAVLAMFAVVPSAMEKGDGECSMIPYPRGDLRREWTKPLDSPTSPCTRGIASCIASVCFIRRCVCEDQARALYDC